MPVRLFRELIAMELELHWQEASGRAATTTWPDFRTNAPVDRCGLRCGRGTLLSTRHRRADHDRERRQRALPRPDGDGRLRPAMPGQRDPVNASLLLSQPDRSTSGELRSPTPQALAGGPDCHGRACSRGPVEKGGSLSERILFDAAKPADETSGPSRCRPNLPAENDAAYAHSRCQRAARPGSGMPATSSSRDRLRWDGGGLQGPPSWAQTARRAQAHPWRTPSPILNSWDDFAPRRRPSHRLRHENIVQIYGVGESNGEPFVALLEFRRGGHSPKSWPPRPSRTAWLQTCRHTLARPCTLCIRSGSSIAI